MTFSSSNLVHYNVSVYITNQSLSVKMHNMQRDPKVWEQQLLILHSFAFQFTKKFFLTNDFISNISSDNRILKYLTWIPEFLSILYAPFALKLVWMLQVCVISGNPCLDPLACCLTKCCFVWFLFKILNHSGLFLVLIDTETFKVVSDIRIPLYVM